jgi:hypothetical protein
MHLNFLFSYISITHLFQVTLRKTARTRQRMAVMAIVQPAARVQQNSSIRLMLHTSQIRQRLKGLVRRHNRRLLRPPGQFQGSAAMAIDPQAVRFRWNSSLRVTFRVTQALQLLVSEHDHCLLHPPAQLEGIDRVQQLLHMATRVLLLCINLPHLNTRTQQGRALVGSLLRMLPHHRACPPDELRRRRLRTLCHQVHCPPLRQPLLPKCPIQRILQSRIHTRAESAREGKRTVDGAAKRASKCYCLRLR